MCMRTIRCVPQLTLIHRISCSGCNPQTQREPSHYCVLPLSYVNTPGKVLAFWHVSDGACSLTRVLHTPAVTATQRDSTLHTAEAVTWARPRVGGRRRRPSKSNHPENTHLCQGQHARASSSTQRAAGVSATSGKHTHGRMPAVRAPSICHTPSRLT